MEAELAATPTKFRRYMFQDFPWNEQMAGLLGPRGVGKSTLMKQRILSRPDPEKWLYVSADHLYFSNHGLYDLAVEFSREGGEHLVVDEIHKYAGWSRELKMMYDTLPSLQVIFTGSSVLDIRQGEADLSRRALMTQMQGLSFREYLSLRHGLDYRRYTLEEIIAGGVPLLRNLDVLPLFKDYLYRGYYPFGFTEHFDAYMQQIIAQTVETDIPQYAGMNVSTARKLKQMLAIIAGLAPYKPSYANLSAELGISKNDVPDHLLYLERAGMIGQLRNAPGGMRSLGKVEKVYIDNPSLMTVMAGGCPNEGSRRETFFYNQMRVTYPALTSSKISDFQIGDTTFEVGGAKKSRRQLSGAVRGVVVRDDIVTATPPFVPLWQFGLTY